MKRKLILSTLVIMITVASWHMAKAQQDDGFIYGKITTIDGNSYIGAIRWGKEEVMWTDHFNASKKENPYIEYLSKSELRSIEEKKNQGWVNVGRYSWNFSTEYTNHVHEFACQFGEIKSIEPTGRNLARVTMQSGISFKVNGEGYNDIGTKVSIIDKEVGLIEIDWERIDFVEFLPTPKKIDAYGSPLFGTVTSSAGKFTGFIEWDHDERLSIDKLDGHTSDGKMSIDFDKIKSIEKKSSEKSIVTLKTGRTIEMSGTNDVNSGNRGIAVTIDGVGRVDIPWGEFEKVTFNQQNSSGPSYAKFTNQSKLSGTLLTDDGIVYKGEIVFDLDEAYDFEMLHGELEGVKFIIPFAYIKDITPRNYQYTKVTLKNGDSFMLGNSQDVSDKNTGILIFSDKDTTYVPWEKVKNINF